MVLLGKDLFQFKENIQVCKGIDYRNMATRSGADTSNLAIRWNYFSSKLRLCYGQEECHWWKFEKKKQELYFLLFLQQLFVNSASDICSEVGAYLSYLQEIICYKLRVLISLICIKLFVTKSECIFLLFALISTRWSCWDLWAFNTTPD